MNKVAGNGRFYQLRRLGRFRLKAFLLAAGHGTRLRPLTDSIPKCLVPIRGTPMLEIWLDVCKRAGIDEVLINVHAHASTIKSFLEDRSRSVRVCVSEETVLLGSAGTLLANRHWVAREANFWVLYGDVLTATDLAKMLAFHRQHQVVATIGLYEVPDPSRCGIVAFDENFVVREFVEKPTNPSSNWAFSGLMIATPALLDVIPQSLPADLGFHVLPQLVGRILAYPIRDFVLDIGTLENFRAAQTAWPGLSALESCGYGN
jgi:mannose-1-phosphate guanylyltransferase